MADTTELQAKITAAEAEVTNAAAVAVTAATDAATNAEDKVKAQAALDAQAGKDMAEKILADLKAEFVKLEDDAKAEEGHVSNVVHVVTRDFKTWFRNVLLEFHKGDEVAEDVGAALKAQGAPIKAVEKAAEVAVEAATVA